MAIDTDELVRILVMDGLSERAAKILAGALSPTTIYPNVLDSVAVASLPVPGSGDAAKVVTVNAGHTGYELDTPDSGGSGVAVHSAPFAFDTVDLAVGVDVAFTDGYVPTAGDHLLNAWFEIDEDWDGTTPKGTASTTPITDSNPGFWITAPVDMTLRDFPQGGFGGGLGLLNSQGKVSALLAPSNNLRVLPGKIVRTAPLRVWVNQTGAPASWASVSAFEAVPALPVTVVAGVNDEFVFTPVATGVPETFTIAPGVYATAQACADAMNAALGATAERFDTLCLVTTYYQGGTGPEWLYVVALDPGTARNGDTVDLGANDVAADLGFIGGGAPYTLVGGAAAGADPVSTVGAARLCVEVFRP